LRRLRYAAPVACLIAVAAEGQGFGLNEIGTCAVGRGFAVTGAPCADASDIYWNPAATTRGANGKTTLTLGGALIALNGGFRQDTSGRRYASDVPTSFVPHLFGNYVMGRTAFGLGVYVPYGLTSQWRDDFPGRFSAKKASLQTFYIQPNIAYAITPTWSIGGGPVLGYSRVELIQSQDFSAQPVPGQPFTFGYLGIASETEFARARIKGSATGAGFHVGVFGRPTPEWTVGARYLSTVRFNYDDADATFTQIPTNLVLPVGNPINSGTTVSIDALVQPQFTGSGALTAQKASTTIKHPWQAAIGVGYAGFRRTLISADVLRLGWSEFNTLPLTFKGAASAESRVLIEDYNDIWAYRVGVEHRVQSTNTWNGITLRGGFSYADTPAPDATVTPLLPDMPRRNTSFGIGIPLGPTTTLDASYLYVGTPGRRGRIIERTSESQTANQLNSGAYDLEANVFSVTLTTTF